MPSFISAALIGLMMAPAHDSAKQIPLPPPEVTPEPERPPCVSFSRFERIERALERRNASKLNKAIRRAGLREAPLGRVARDLDGLDRLLRRRALDRAEQRLLDDLPEGARFWGITRHERKWFVREHALPLVVKRNGDDRLYRVRTGREWERKVTVCRCPASAGGVVTGLYRPALWREVEHGGPLVSEVRVKHRPGYAVAYNRRGRRCN